VNIYEQGTLYTLGYAHPDAPAQLDRLMRQSSMLLLDIRYAPFSRWMPTWNRWALASRYGDRYQWEQRLGNLNYQQKERGIQLATGHQEAIVQAALMLTQGFSLVLLCVCKHEKACHRLVVAQAIQEAMTRQAQEVRPC
jgi:Protein of unknown function, DUF488